MHTERLHHLIAEMLDLQESEVTQETSRENTEAWDSLNHLQLITAVESAFAIKLTMEEIAAIKTVGDLEKIVLSRVRQT